MIAQGRCRKSDVLAYFEGRKEREIVIEPKKVALKCINIDDNLLTVHGFVAVEAVDVFLGDSDTTPCKIVLAEGVEAATVPPNVV